MEIWNYVRSFGLGGFLCGGLAGLLFLVYPGALPPHAAMPDVLLVGGFLGAAGQRLLATVFGPIHFYSRLLQLTLLRPLIGEQTYGKVLGELSLRYFLGEQHRGFDTPGASGKARALPPQSGGKP
jgi:hypothetical protein